MDRQALKDGKARVAGILIQPLNDTFGLQRGRGVTVAMHLDRMSELQSRLAYLDGPDLVALREAVIARLRPKPGGVWPSVADILSHANLIRIPAPSDSPMVTSYMASAAGARSKDEQCHVELYHWLKDRGRPPSSSFEWREIRDKSEANRRRRQMIKENRTAGWLIGSEDLRFADWYRQMEERAEALLQKKDVEA